jgi:hypothetical protein
MKIDHTNHTAEQKRACFSCHYDMEFVNSLDDKDFIWGPCFHCDKQKFIYRNTESKYCLMCKDCIAENEYYRKVASL